MRETPSLKFLGGWKILQAHRHFPTNLARLKRKPFCYPPVILEQKGAQSEAFNIFFHYKIPLMLLVG